MKTSHIIFAIVLIIMLMQCAVQQKTTYNIPAYLPEEKKTELMANLEKGKQLYIKYCSDCHGIFKKGKDSIPDFTNKEIADYTVAYKANDSKNHAAAKKLLPEEMSMIITFLQLRKIDSLPVHNH